VVVAPAAVMEEEVAAVAEVKEEVETSARR
jgi:hypothetical protein